VSYQLVTERMQAAASSLTTSSTTIPQAESRADQLTNQAQVIQKYVYLHLFISAEFLLNFERNKYITVNEKNSIKFQFLDDGLDFCSNLSW